MLLRKLSAINYRNLAAIDIELSPNVNCFVGSNGVGKSNILDAVYYLSFCRGYASVQDVVNLRHGSDFFMLDGNYETEQGTLRHVCCSMKQGSRKHLKVDGKDVKRISEHVGSIPLVIITPSDSALITGGSEERRNFLNAAIMQYDSPYLDAVIRYERSLKQRNALLKQEGSVDEQLFSVLEEMMDATGQMIYERRVKFLEEFRPIFTEMYARLSGRDDESAEIAYVSHVSHCSLLEQLRSWREKERIVGYTLHGVHKDELELTLNGFAVKREASQGQQKTFFIALKLSQFMFLKQKGERRVPLLLLDDIFDKLDSSRVSRIIDYVSGDSFGQIFITDTRREHLDKILASTHRDYHLFSVNNGEVAPFS